MERVAEIIFRLRSSVLILLALLTVFLGIQASRLRIATDFSKMIPQGHAYMENYRPFKALFGGGNQVRISVSRRHESIVDRGFLEKFRQIHEDVMFVKGIDRRTVRSMVSPETLVVIINEEGFNVGPVVPDILPDTEEGLAQIEKNIALGGLIGWMVSMDMRSALIYAEIYESGVDYLSVYRKLNEIRNKYSDDDIRIGINGFAMVVGFVNDALPKIVLLFGLSTLITFLILYRFLRYVRLAFLPLFSGGLSVLWGLGVTNLIGLSLDPMTTIIPFLVFAIGTSHGVQMINRYLEECVKHTQGYDAALHALAGLMIPGTVALATDVIGFLTILFVPIGMIRDLAITASVGMACIVIANILVLTLVLSFFPNLSLPEADAAETKVFGYGRRVLFFLNRLSHGRTAYWTLGISAVLLLIGLFSSRSMTVGDVNPGEPLLWEDSVYNQDAANMMKDYMFGIDWLSVVVTGDEAGLCKRYDVLRTVEDFEWQIGNVPGVTVVISGLLLARMINETFHEGDIRWRALPKSEQDLGFVMAYAKSEEDTPFMTMGCQSMNIMVYLLDHKGETIRRVIQKCKEFIAEHPMNGARILLGGGNAGVMAATNEVVGGAQLPMLLLIYLSIFGICVVVFRSLRGPLFILAPLLLVSVLATAFMKMVGLGLNVNTLPVAAMGVGIGVDYGIYFYARLKREEARQGSFADAVAVTLQTTGAAVLYTALTLSAGVVTWLLSDLKFQADMGLLLAFIFLANMVGALILLPALMYVFDEKGKSRGKGR